MAGVDATIPARQAGMAKASGRAVGAGLSATLLLALVGLAARPVEGGPGGVPQPVLAEGVLWIGLLGLTLVDLALVVILVAALWPQRRRRSEGDLELVSELPPVSSVTKLGLLLLPVLGVALVAVILRWWSLSPGGVGDSIWGPPAGASPIVGPWVDKAVGSSQQGAGPWAWLPLLVLLGLVAVSIAVLVRRGLPLLAGSSRVATAAMAVATADSLEALLSCADPRQAVIAAYLAMERSLRAEGLARRPWEAPFEYLERVLCEGGAPPIEARTLTNLFGIACFSAHPVDERMRKAAVLALRRVRASPKEPRR